LRAVLFFLIIFFSLAAVAFAQSSPQLRRLPPSLERELKLKRGGKIRIVGFVDTLKAQNIIAQSIRDSSSAERDSLTVRDSAIIVIDSSVSLTDKEWLDSVLTQLPEYKMTPEGIRFYYPADILIETNRKVVPLDTTLPSRMDPVTKEDLPLYDDMPMPRPLRQLSLPRTSVELGAGAPYLPLIDVSSLVVSNEKSALELDGKFKTTSASEPAIKQYWKIGANGSFAFPDTSISSGERVPQLDVGASAGSNRRQVADEQASLTLANLNAGFTIGSLEKLRFESHAFFSSLNENYHSGMTEDIVGISLVGSQKIFQFLAELGIRYESIANFTDLLEEKMLITMNNNLFQLKVGALFLNGSNEFFTSPIIEIRKHLSSVFEIGASFMPENKLNSLRDLTAQNLFYAAGNVSGGITTEPIHLNVFANYFLSLDNEIHAQFRYIYRNNEPIFFSDTSINGNAIFTTTPLNTRRIEFEAGWTTFFGKDKLIGSLLFRSVADRDSSITLPYIPTAQLHIAYQFGFSQKFIPQIEVVDLQRFNNTFTFLNLDAKYIFSPTFQLKFRAENIFGSAGDFWTGYDEYPRSIWVSGEYRF
jgi:hypothetical protein